MKNRNILLITIDALRQDHLSCYGYDKDTTPNIDGLAKKGWKFLEAITHGGGTPEAFPSILTGNSPPLHWKDFGIKNNLSVAQWLVERGYNTGALHSNPYLVKSKGYGKGFNMFNENFSSGNILKNKIKKILPEIDIIKEFVYRFTVFGLGQKTTANAETLAQNAIDWIKRQSNPFFLWLHFMDVHEPYYPPASFRRKLSKNVSNLDAKSLNMKMRTNPEKISEKEKNKIIELYDDCIRYIDEAIGYTLENIKQSFPNTFIILTSDHGEEFGDHGGFSHTNAKVYEEIIKVPLIISSPCLDGKKIERPVGLRKIVSWIMDESSGEGKFNKRGLLNLEKNVEDSEGLVSVSLYPKHRLRAVSYRTSKWKLIKTEILKEGKNWIPYSPDKNESFTGKSKFEFYNIQSDPNEYTNLWEKENKISSSYRKALETKIEKSKIEKRVKESKI